MKRLISAYLVTLGAMAASYLAWSRRELDLGLFLSMAVCFVTLPVGLVLAARAARAEESRLVKVLASVAIAVLVILTLFFLALLVFLAVCLYLWLFPLPPIAVLGEL
jgi:ABC-type microcin C transport system permease subunit YejB